MKRFRRSIVALAQVAGLAGLLAVSGHAAAQIAGTKHNLSSSGTQANRVTAGTDEICVFCHTPHGSNTAVAAPLWNKALPPSTYTTYSTTNSSTIDGTVLAVGSVSLACLSCHDGTQAMDNIINAPGSGGYDSVGTGTGTNQAAGRAYTWNTSTRVDTTGKLLNADGFIANLSTDLTNDHPIGIQYCGGGKNAGSPTGTCVDPDFNATANQTINSQVVWWVDTTGGTAAKREKTDMILYTRDFGAAVGSNPGGVGPSVECASCHDPHSGNTTFLRIANSGSAVCLACHNK